MGCTYIYVLFKVIKSPGKFRKVSPYRTFSSAKAFCSLLSVIPCTRHPIVSAALYIFGDVVGDIYSVMYLVIHIR